MNKNQSVIDARKAREQAVLLEQLRKMPIVQIACEKSGVSRATYYRWKKEDEQFAAAADEALFDGTALVSDMAESQLLAQIRDNNLGAIMYWLKHRNPNYNNRLEVTAKLKHEDDKLTPEQEAAITEALKLASLATDEGASTTPSSNSSNATTEENITGK